MGRVNANINGQPSTDAGRYERDAAGNLRYNPVSQQVPSRRDAIDLTARSHRHSNLPAWQRILLVTTAWSIDTVAHLALGALAFAACYSLPHTRTAVPAAAIATWLTISFIHRVLVQHATGATAAKALLGLRLENPDHSTITRWQLTELWLAPLALLQLLSC